MAAVAVLLPFKYVRNIFVSWHILSKRTVNGSAYNSRARVVYSETRTQMRIYMHTNAKQNNTSTQRTN